MGQQLISSQKGEVEFRKKLVQQQIEGKSIFNDEYDGRGIEEILDGRMKQTHENMCRLGDMGIDLVPYVELGAERGQRSLVMENDIGVSGAAVDISYDMLRSCNYYQMAFDKPKSPLRVCADANTLPFLTNTIPFVFCYETLHHFPDPGPIVAEAYRVLSSGGSFFFAEEPFKRAFHINLYKAKKAHSKERLNSGTVRRVLDYFFAEDSCNEVEHGIIENHDITIRMWKKALDEFEKKDVRLRRGKKISSELYRPRNWVKFVTSYLVGGEISGICRKPGMRTTTPPSIREVLACPSCRESDRDSQLHDSDSYLACSYCNHTFPIKDGVLFLLTPDKLELLYPGVFQQRME